MVEASSCSPARLVEVRRFSVTTTAAVSPNAQVYKALRGGVQTVAVKRVALASGRQKEDFLKEVAILKGLRDANIVMFLGACLQVGP